MSKKSKSKREDRLIAGDAFLEDQGIDVDADDSILLPSIVKLIGTDRDGDLAIADLLGSIPREDAATRLKEWADQQPPDKDLRRIIRASLFRLEQRGIASAARPRPEAAPVRLIDRPDPIGWLSPLDGAGNRLAWLSRARPEGGFLILTSVLNDRLGMRQVGLRQSNKSQFREAREDAAAHSAPMVAVSWKWVDHLMGSAHQLAPPRNEPGGGYPLMRGELVPTPHEEVPSPADEVMSALPGNDEPELLRKSADLFKEREYLGWALHDDLVRVHQARFRDARESTVVINKEQMGERLTGVIDKAFAEVFSGETRALYASRLAEMALWFALAERPGPAATSWAVHRVLADRGRDLADVSFLRALVFRSFLHLMPQESREKEDDPSPDSPTIILPPE